MGSICEKCDSPIDGTYASGRFCSLSCANSRKYSEHKRHEINEKIRKKLLGAPSKRKGVRRVPYADIVCPCGKVFSVPRCLSTRKYCSRLCKARFVDWSRASKNAFKRGTRTITGGHTKWFKYKDISVQGSYELRTCAILDHWLTMSRVLHWEYSNERITYTWEDGSEHTYLLDFKVVDSDHNVFFIETKGFIRENDERKWKATRDLGIDLRIWFYEDIVRYENEIKQASIADVVLAHV